jgi:hypothetical protein
MTPEPDAVGAKIEPHPLSNVITAGPAPEAAETTRPSADSAAPDLAEQGTSDKEAIGGAPAMAITEADEARAEPVESSIGKRKAEEEAEEERKRVKVEPDIGVAQVEVEGGGPEGQNLAEAEQVDVGPGE